MEETGIIVKGIVKAINMTKKGVLANGNQYGHSIKIKLEIPSKIEKEIAGEMVEIEDFTIVEAKIKLDSEEAMLKKYKQIELKKGQVLSLKTNLRFDASKQYWAEFLQDTKQK